MAHSYMTLTDKERDMVSQETKTMIWKELDLLKRNPNKMEVAFSPSLTNIERKYIHDLARKLNLNSKSKGHEPDRFITVYKVPKSQKAQKFLNVPKDLTLKPESVYMIENLLASNPVTQADKLCSVAEPEFRGAGQRRRKSQLSGATLLMPKTDFQRTRNFRQNLPIWSYEEDIYNTILHRKITLVVGETGSGKTTQVPQIIMEYSELSGDKCHIICSMPRRVAAVTISERVAFERGEPLGDTVGYQIHLDSRVSSKTILTYCTNGVLLRSLLGGNEWLRNVSHIILDEVHERDKLTDFTLIVLKEVLLRHKHLKLILMSATIDTVKFCTYFEDFPRKGDHCGVVEVPGKMFEVKEVYLEHILEGAEYMSSEMSSMKREKESLRSLQGDVFSDDDPRTYGRTEVVPVPLQINRLDYEVRCEMDSLLNIALTTGTRESMKNLVDFMCLQGVPVDYQLETCGRTPLMAAAIHGDIDAVDDLIHMNPDLSIESKEQKTALMYAVEVGNSDILEFFDSYLHYLEQKKANMPEPSAADCELSPQVKELVDLYEKCHINKDIDEKLILCVLKTINDDGRDGAVLIFLPGYDQIMCVRDKILENIDSFKNTNLDIHILHSKMKPVDQKKVFCPPQKGHRKVILSTNIAETSVTINDVIFVIDCGKVKELSHNSLNGAYTLESDWISKSCAEQRKGRAGRVAEGICFRLYTKQRYLSFKQYKIPELLRSSIAELCLQAKQLAPTGTSIAEFLAKALDPPLPEVTRNTINLLKKMEALTEEEELTKLGRHLLEIPLQPHFGKMVVYAVLLRCLDPVLTIVCCLSNGEVFKLPVDPGEKARTTRMKLELSQKSLSDHMVYLNAFRAWEEAIMEYRDRRFCHEYYISAATMDMIDGTKQQILGQLELDQTLVNVNSDNWAVVKAALTAGLYPNVARVDSQKKSLQTPNESRVSLHSSSILKVANDGHVYKRESEMLRKLPSQWVLFEESHRHSFMPFSNLRTCTAAAPLTVCLFSGPSRIPPPTSLEDEESKANEDPSEAHPLPSFATIKIDDFIHFDTDCKTAECVYGLRTKWNAFVSRSINNLRSTQVFEVDDDTLSAVVEVLQNEDVPVLKINPIRQSLNNNKRVSSNKTRYLPQRGRGRGSSNNPRTSFHENWRRECSPSYEAGGGDCRWRNNPENQYTAEQTFKARGGMFRGRPTGAKVKNYYPGQPKWGHLDVETPKVLMETSDESSLNEEMGPNDGDTRSPVCSAVYYHRPQSSKAHLSTKQQYHKPAMQHHNGESAERGERSQRNTAESMADIDSLAARLDTLKLSSTDEEVQSDGAVSSTVRSGRQSSRPLVPAKQLVLEQKQFRYYLIRKGSQQLVRSAFTKGVWPFTEKAGRDLLEAKKYSDHVFVIIWVGSAQTTKGECIKLQGWGKLGGVTEMQKLPGQSKDLTTVFNVEWRVRDPLTLNLSKVSSNMRDVYNVPDGQVGELEHHIATSLFAFWDFDYQRKTGQRRSLY